MKKKFGWNEYFKPTPKLFRKIGDATLVLGACLTGAAGVLGPNWLVITGTALTIFGKVTTNFFSE